MSFYVCTCVYLTSIKRTKKNKLGKDKPIKDLLGSYFNSVTFLTEGNLSNNNDDNDNYNNNNNNNNGDNSSKSNNSNVSNNGNKTFDNNSDKSLMIMRK